jgi:hypothetical protein
MAPTPRIIRAIPSDPVTRPDTGMPVIATLHWHDGTTTEVAAIATAWTRDAVEVSWTWAPRTQDPRRDWVPAQHVRRWQEADLQHPTPPPEQRPRPASTPADRPPTSAGTKKKNRW